MNDRFKFRVWHKPLKTMHYNDFVVTATGYVAKIYEQDLYMMKFNQQDLEFDKQCILMQCTGLKDKNGTLIYENDFIKNYDNRIYKVIWQDDAACFLVENIKTGCKQGIYSLISLSNDLEVIGNIYANKELLEVENANI